MIELMISMARSNRFSKEKQVEFQKRRFEPVELLKVKRLSRKELLYLMVFCEVRTFNDVPVTALEDDEMRMAYVLWRAEGQKERKGREREAKKRIRFFARMAKGIIKKGVLK